MPLFLPKSPLPTFTIPSANYFQVTAHQETQSKLKLNLEKVNELELSLEETKRTVQVVQSQLAEEKTNNEALQKDILEKEGKIRELKTQVGNFTAFEGF